MRPRCVPFSKPFALAVALPARVSRFKNRRHLQTSVRELRRISAAGTIEACAEILKQSTERRRLAYRCQQRVGFEPGVAREAFIHGAAQPMDGLLSSVQLREGRVRPCMA